MPTATPSQSAPSATQGPEPQQSTRITPESTTPQPPTSTVQTPSPTPCLTATATDTGTLTIIVNAVNDAPVAVDDTVTTKQETSVLIAVLANDTHADSSTMTIATVTSPSNGTVTQDGSVLTYQPNSSFSGSDSSLLYRTGFQRRYRYRKRDGHCQCDRHGMFANNIRPRE